jgi:GNAT superfamily N-acetyltransferase
MAKMNLEWLLDNLDEEREEGNIYGYVTNTRKDVQLKNYMEKQRIPETVSIIREMFERIAILTNMYVNEVHRGEGIGTSLLEQFIENASAKNAQAIILVADTADSNEFELVNWYENYGFYIIYGERDSFPVMAKEL